MRQEWLEDLAEEARQYKTVYRELLEKTREPLKKRLLEKNMLDKEAQIRCLQRMGSGNGIPAEDLSKIIAFCVSLYDALIAEVPVLAGFSISRTEMRLLPADVFLMLYCVSRTGMFGSAQ